MRGGWTFQLCGSVHFCRVVRQIEKAYKHHKHDQGKDAKANPFGDGALLKPFFKALCPCYYKSFYLFHMSPLIILDPGIYHMIKYIH